MDRKRRTLPPCEKDREWIAVSYEELGFARRACASTTIDLQQDKELLDTVQDSILLR